ncbi:MAG: hypothetical protein IT381_21240 [Deltaproteobacteria bacterium]|nr:hypothetical protein [Deltaproteobacteria bacterium]
MNAPNKGLTIGGPCMLLSGEFTSEDWRGAGQFDWLVAETKSERATKELGERRIFGMPCRVFLCDDGRVRAVTIIQREKEERT